MNSQTIDNTKSSDQETIKENFYITSSMNKNGLISYMKPRICEVLKNKENEASIKSKYNKKESRPKSATGVRSLLKK